MNIKIRMQPVNIVFEGRQYAVITEATEKFGFNFSYGFVAANFFKHFILKPT